MEDLAGIQISSINTTDEKVNETNQSKLLNFISGECNKKPNYRNMKL